MYCIIDITLFSFHSAGIAFYYCLFQLAVWWFCHEISLFWKIRFPFHARSFETTHRIKYVHITMVIVGLVLPALPVIVTFTAGDPSGFGLTRFPPILCTGLQRDSTFYSLVLPIDILSAIGIPLLIIIFWIVHKVIVVYTHSKSCEWHIPQWGWPCYSSKMKMERLSIPDVFLKCQVEALRCVVHVSVFEWHKFEICLEVPNYQKAEDSAI